MDRSNFPSDLVLAYINSGFLMKRLVPMSVKLRIDRVETTDIYIFLSQCGMHLFVFEKYWEV